MTDTMFRFCDDLGPIHIVHLYNPRLGLNGIVVVDNVAAGPAIGGTRMAPDVSVEECFRLARAMTFKNAAAGLAHGGAKSVIFGDPKMPAEKKEQTIRVTTTPIVVAIRSPCLRIACHLIETRLRPMASRLTGARWLCRNLRWEILR